MVRRLKLQCTQGFTLVEALVAAGLLAFIAVTSVSYVRMASNSSRQSMTSCRLNNNSILNHIRSLGVASQIATFVPVAGTNQNVVTDSPSTFATPIYTDPQHRWPLNYPTVSTDQAPYVNNHLLYNGFMTTLESVYNSVQGICTGSSSPSNFVSIQNSTAVSNLLFAAPTSAILQTEQNEINITDVGLQIVPYDIYLNGPPSCSLFPPGSLVAPAGLYPDSSPSSPFSKAASIATRQSGVYTNVGFAVQVITKFQTKQDAKNNVTESCITEQKFQYPPDPIQPAVPNQPTVTMNSTMPTVCSPADNNTYTMTVSAAAGTKAGSVLLCKDSSFTPNPLMPGALVATSAYGGGAPPVVQGCYAGNAFSPSAGPGPQISVANPGNLYYPNNGDNFNGFSYAAGTSTTTKSGPSAWVACYNVTLCGVTASGTSPTTATFTTSPPSYSMTFKNLPSDCRISLEVVTVDPAGNQSANYGMFDIPMATSSVFSGTYDVPRPRCNMYCGTWPNGYYTCGGGC